MVLGLSSGSAQKVTYDGRLAGDCHVGRNVENGLFLASTKRNAAFLGLFNCYTTE